MSGSAWEIGRMPSAAELAQIERDAHRARAQALAAAVVAGGRAVAQAVRHWFGRQPAAPFAGSLSGRAR